MKINFPFTEELLILNSIFNNVEGNLRIVGGAVRNYLINKQISDFDLSCKFTPEETINILKKNNIKYAPVGIKFGTVIAIINGKPFEITATREDVSTDGRHAVVKYISDFEADSNRRDFTFNALYLDFYGNIYDYHDGISDLHNGIVRFIGNAETRIKEDYLRVLRFFRFYCYYGTFLDNDGLKYSILLKDNLINLSGERIKAEMIKIFNADYSVKTLKIMQEHNILQIITNINDFKYKNLEIFYSIKKFLSVGIDSILPLALFINSEDELNILRERWRLSNKENNEILKLLKYGNKKLNFKEILFFEENKSFVINLIVYNSILRSDEISCGLSEYIMQQVDFIRKCEIPLFPITGKDLDLIGQFNKKEYGKVLSFAKWLFVKSDFTLNKNQILEKLLEIKVEDF